MKKTLVILLAAALILTALCACGGSKTDVIYFQNDTGEKIPAFFVSTTDNESWGDALNSATVSVGGKITIDIEKLPAGTGVIYDIGAVTDSGLLCEFYEVPVTTGDVIAISLAGDGETAYAKITGADGQITDYQGVCYNVDESVD